MKVYIILQEWQTDSEHQSEIIGVYSNKNAAVEALNKLYEDDLEWICERCNCEVEDLDQNEKESDEYSFVCLNEFFSENSIREEVIMS